MYIFPHLCLLPFEFIATLKQNVQHCNIAAADCNGHVVTVPVICTMTLCSILKTCAATKTASAI